MLKYIVKRILQMIPMMIILSIVVFCMVRLIPGAAITLVVMSFSLIGDGLRDAFDPRLKNV